MNDEMINYIESIEAQMIKSERLFLHTWNEAIKENLPVNDTFQIKDYVDIFGGYSISKDEFSKMDSQLKSFYENAGSIYDRVHLRGYDYYKADPLMHMQQQNCTHHELWQVFKEKWEKYKAIGSFEYLSSSPSAENWFGTLGLLEYMFQDLTSIRWFIFRNDKTIRALFGDEYKALVDIVNNGTEKIAQGIARLLKFELQAVAESLAESYKTIVYSPLLTDLLNTDFPTVEKASIRTMREGDCTMLIYAAYLLKLKPCCESNKYQKIKLISNAFGAMNIGLIMKYLMSDVCKVEHLNLLYAQHRSEGDFVYEDALVDRCCWIDPKEQVEESDIDAVFIVDDSICFGKSFKGIKDSVGHENTYLLPLTLNCNGMKYFKVGISQSDNLEEILRQSTRYAKEVNQVFPAFFSFWDFRKTIPEDCGIHDETYKFAIYGSDLLLNHLWRLYYYEIVFGQL